MLLGGKTPLIPAIGAMPAFGPIWQKPDIDAMALNGGVFLGDCKTLIPSPAVTAAVSAIPIDEVIIADGAIKKGKPDPCTSVFAAGIIGPKPHQREKFQELHAGPADDGGVPEERTTVRLKSMSPAKINTKTGPVDGIEFKFLIKSLPADDRAASELVRELIKMISQIVQWHEAARFLIVVDNATAPSREETDRVVNTLKRLFNIFPEPMLFLEVRFSKTTWAYKLTRRPKPETREEHPFATPPADTPPEVAPQPLMQIDIKKVSKPQEPVVLSCILPADSLPADLSMYFIVKLIAEALQKEPHLHRLVIDLTLAKTELPYPLAQTWPFVESLPADIFPVNQEVFLTLKFSESTGVNYSFFRSQPDIQNGRTDAQKSQPELRRAFIDESGNRWEILEIRKDPEHRYDLLVRTSEVDTKAKGYDPKQTPPVEIYIDNAVMSLAGESMIEIMKDAADVVRQRKGLREIIFVVPGSGMLAKNPTKILSGWATALFELNPKEKPAAGEVIEVEGPKDPESTGVTVRLADTKTKAKDRAKDDKEAEDRIVIIEFRIVAGKSVTKARYKEITKTVGGVKKTEVSMLAWTNVELKVIPPLLHQPAKRRRIEELVLDADTGTDTTPPAQAAAPATVESQTKVPAAGAARPVVHTARLTAKKSDPPRLTLKEFLTLDVGRLVRGEKK